jgi:hypothetical protein
MLRCPLPAYGVKAREKTGFCTLDWIRREWIAVPIEIIHYISALLSRDFGIHFKFERKMRGQREGKSFL